MEGATLMSMSSVSCSRQTKISPAARSVQHRHLARRPFSRGSLKLRRTEAQPLRRCWSCRTSAGAAPCATYPTPETEKERSPVDFPQEWITPQPSRRPDIFPEFEKLDAPLPKIPLPGDPELPDEEEEEDEDEKKEKPDKEEPEKPAPDTPDE